MHRAQDPAQTLSDAIRCAMRRENMTMIELSKHMDCSENTARKKVNDPNKLTMQDAAVLKTVLVMEDKPFLRYFERRKA